MSTIIKLVRGSVEWHEHRRAHRNASETPIVLGVSRWTTPYQLWQARLVGLASHTSESWGGVSVTRFWKSGAVDCRKIPELGALDSEKYRGPQRHEVRVTTTS